MRVAFWKLLGTLSSSISLTNSPFLETVLALGSNTAKLNFSHSTLIPFHICLKNVVQQNMRTNFKITQLVMIIYIL